MSARALRVVDEPPTYGARSVLEIGPGRWRMRNGHTAQVEKLLQLPYGTGKMFPVWKGICIECNEPKTWNVNGTYAAVGKHALDILERT